MVTNTVLIGFSVLMIAIYAIFNNKIFYDNLLFKSTLIPFIILFLL